MEKEQKTSIHGHTVSFDQRAENGKDFLKSRPAEVAKVFFAQASSRGSAVFEDHSGVRYKLVRKGSGYELIHL